MTAHTVVRVHSRPLDCGKESVRLYYLSRALDPDGSGVVSLTMEQMTSFFGNGKSTIYRWLKEGEGLFWCRNHRVRDRIVLHLIGLKQICKNLSLGVHKNVLGAIADISLSAIATRFGAKALSTQMDALQCQKQGWWAKSQSVPECMRKFVLKPWEKIVSDESTGTNEQPRTNLQTSRYTFESEGWTIPGTSISGIRKKTDWKCDRTIQRRLSKTYRQEHGLEPLPKLRVAEEVTNPNMMALLANSCSGYLVDNNRVYKVLKFTNHKFFVLKHCIYGEGNIQLLGLRRLRGKVNRHLKK